MAVKLSGTSAILGEALALIAPHLPPGAPPMTGPFDESKQPEPRASARPWVASPSCPI